MRKQLEDLALQAGGSHYPTVGGKNLEKFADLLIKECAEVAINNGCGDFVDIKQKLFEHFGIEE